MAFFTFNTVDKKHWDPKQKSYVGFTLGVSLGSCGRVACVCVCGVHIAKTQVARTIPSMKRL